MVMFLLTTTVLMMNVLIALINVAFAKGDDAWRLVWIKSRLRHIESAENLSYHIPGFRQTYDWYPREIYFTATAKEIEDYLKKHPKSRHEEHITEFESQHTTASRTFSNPGVNTPDAGGSSRHQNEAISSSADMTSRNDASGMSKKSPLQSLLRGGGDIRQGISISNGNNFECNDVQQRTARISSQITTPDGSRPSPQSQQPRRLRLIVEEEEDTQKREPEMGKGKGKGRKEEEASNKDIDEAVVMELFHKLEDQMEGVLRQAQESQQQALESQRQAQESQRQMELNQQQMQALIDRMIQLTSSIPASPSSSL
ncbi:MAG: hypothetical protein J3R72DRAFT_156265 [Linnemannia gamsii]|nr:MAG: hypothetical protein J3R72DRAFT_156265 [Linnemannia gamsii]